MYLDLRSVRLFKLGFVIQNWKAYIKNKIQRAADLARAEQKVIRLLNRNTMTKVMVSLFGRCLVKAKAVRFHAR